MDNKKLELYLNKIEEWVIDENKILTYKSVSKNFEVHVNTAKQLLHCYWARQKNHETFPISATFLVAGKLSDGTLNFTIVNENDLKNTCLKFSEVTSKHVYSIQSVKKVKEIKVLNDGIRGDRSTESVIKFSGGILKCKTESSPQNKLFFEPEKTHSTEPKNTDQNQTDQNKLLASDAKLESLQKSSETSSKSPKEKIPSENEKNVGGKNEVEKSKEKEKKSKGNIVNFFANSTSKNQTVKVTEKINEDVSKNKDKKNSGVLVESKGKGESSYKSKIKKSSPKKNDKAEHERRQKRKRIQVFSDSESSGNSSEEDVDVEMDEKKKMEEEEEEEDILIPSTLPEEENKVEINFKNKNKRKKRKIVDVTVMSQDGYLETKKEIVYATDSEEETEIQTQPLPESNNSDPKKFKLENKEKKRNSSVGPKKQSSLLTFFKKN